jgi:hypothetical protein
MCHRHLKVGSLSAPGLPGLRGSFASLVVGGRIRIIHSFDRQPISEIERYFEAEFRTTKNPLLERVSYNEVKNGRPGRTILEPIRR